MISKALYSSLSGEWGTPQAFYDKLNGEFHFTLDPCATPENAKCYLYYTIEGDGLSQPWEGRVFCNPPYGRGIAAWIRKAYEEAQRGALVVVLAPCRTSTRWWHEWAMKCGEIRFVKGRLRFEGASNNAPFPSVVLIFRQGIHYPNIIGTMNQCD